MFWRFLHWRYKKSKRPGAADEPHRLRFLWRLSIWTVRIFMFIVIVDLFYVANIWPDWERLKTSAVPKSRFMHVYARERKKHKNWPYRRWSRVPMEKIPAHVSRAVIVGEDSRFYEHGGFDFLAFRDAMGRNVEVGRMRYGASTISQQTVKNLFLSSTRTPLRKWHELLITWGMERHLFGRSAKLSSGGPVSCLLAKPEKTQSSHCNQSLPAQGRQGILLVNPGTFDNKTQQKKKISDRPGFARGWKAAQE